jgi:phospholipase/carboxylesterase
MMSKSNDDLHEGGGILTGGPALKDASGAIVLLHGRGGSATEMISLGQDIALRGLALLAPQAAEHTWYPHSFLAPIEMNEPWLTSAMEKVESLLMLCAEFAIPTTRVAIVGFSQGACLVTEFVARHPTRYGAVIAFTGGLLGPVGSDLAHPGSLGGTPALLSSGDSDPYIPWSRVEETAQQFRLMDASVELNRYPGRAHTVLSEELDAAQKLLCSALQC